MAKHGLTGLVAALVLTAVTVAINLFLPEGPVDPDTHNAAVTILTTVVTFFAVATITVSVSTTLLSTAAGRSESDLMTVLVDDRERDFLLTTIFASFLVSLANLWMLAASSMRPLVALALPSLLAVGTLLLMVGYIVERVRLFDELGLAGFIARRIDGRASILPHLGTSKSGMRLEVKVQCGCDLLRIAAIMRGLVEKRRFGDAYDAMELAIDRLTALVELQLPPASTFPSASQPRDSVSKLRRGLPSFDGEVDMLLRDVQLEPIYVGDWELGDLPVDQSWWLAELAAIAAIQDAVLAAGREGDTRMVERWLRSLDQVWIHRFMPALGSDHSGGDALLACRVLLRGLREVANARSWATSSTEPREESRGRRLPDSWKRFGYLWGDLAVAYVEADSENPLKWGIVDGLLADLEQFMQQFRWRDRNDLPLFIRPDIVQRYLLDNGVGAKHASFVDRFRQREGRGSPSWPDDGGPWHPPEDFYLRYPSEELEPAIGEFAALSEEHQLQVRRRAGDGYNDLVDGLKNRRWAAEEATADVGLPAWDELVYVRELIGRVGLPSS